MSLRDTWIQAARGRGAGVSGALLVAALTPLEWLFRAGFGVYMGAERLGLRKRRRASARVVSVGNLTLGGTGKTPVVESLARALSRNRRVCVLLRGYGGRKSREGLLVSDGRETLCAWEDCGDEAALLAASLPGVVVLAGKDRCVNAERAVRDYGAEVILLDDGLQYWQLHRDADIVLVDARCPFGNGRVMPAGMLREPLAGLRRASAVILTHANEVSREALQVLGQRMARLAPRARVHTAQYAPVELAEPGGTLVPAEELRRRRVLVLCGIGSPESFSVTLEDAGASVVAERFFPDHHPYTQKDLDEAEQWRLRSGADWIVTTKKDGIRIGGLRAPESLRVLGADILVSDFDGLAALVRGGEDKG